MNSQHSRNTMRRWASPAGLYVVCFSLLPSVANAEIEGIFSDAGDALSVEAPISPDIPSFQRRIVRMDLMQLDVARQEVLAGRPAHLTLNLFNEVSFRAIVERTAPTSSGYSLSGKLKDIPFGTMALVLNDRVAIGKVRTLDAVYTIRSISPGTYLIERTEPIEFVEDDRLRPPPVTSEPDSLTDARIIQEDDGSEIDVLVAWTRAARKDAGGIRHIETWIDLAVVETNDAYAASDGTQRIRLVGAVEVNYESRGYLRTDLPRLLNQSDSYMDEIHDLRDSYAADLVHLVSSGICGGGGTIGLAYAMSYPSADFASSAFSASTFCDLANLQHASRGLSSRTFAHELGHNMGLQHDRYVPNTTLNKPYPYSHGYVNQKAFDAGAIYESRWRTVMAYDHQCRAAGFGCPQLLRFSNPNQRYPDAGGDPMGIPGDDPSEEVDGPADAVRSLDDTRRIVANFRPSASRCTYRLSQDTVTVAPSGGAFSIDLETGQGCAYTARSHDAFLSVATGGSGTASGQVQYEVEVNNGYARVGAISVAGEMLVVRQSGTQTYAGVCDRTPQIRNAIAAWANRPCGLVTEFDLSEIPYLRLAGHGIRSLRAGDFAGLASLRALDLSGNSIAGAIPPELGQLTNLGQLNLKDNELEGALPEELSGLTKLRRLFLQNNRLTGGVPAWLGGLTNLDSVHLQDNRLTGDIPSELGQLKSVTSLDFSNNRLSGVIPAELGSMDRLQLLNLSGNQLSGPVPVDLSRPKLLAVVHLHNNQLNGTIPAELARVRLARLSLNDNQLTGTIPVELAMVPTLSRLQLHNNRLTGAVPAELTVPQNLRILHLAGNLLTGCIPGALRDVADNDLDQLGLGYCAAVSIANGGYPSAPPELGRVTEGTAAALTILAEPPQDTAFSVTVAVSGSDAFGVTKGNRTVTIPSGGSETTLTITTADDDTEEPDGHLTATVLADTDYALFVSRSSASIIIDDDEGPSAPTIDSLTPQDGALTVTWTPPQDDGGSVTAYDLRHRPSPPTQGWRVWTLMDSATMGALQRDITGLTNRVEYDVQVRAVNADADGTWSEIAKGTPRACPDHIQLGDCRTLLAAMDTLVGDGTAMNWAIGIPIEEWTGVEVNRRTGRVVVIRLASQGLSGTIPAELGSLTELTVLSLSNNGLTGMIPPQLKDLTRLQELWLSNNRLTGTIPPELGNVPYLQYLSLSQNELTGTIPPELGRLRNLDWLLLNSNKLTGPIPAELGGLANVDTLWLLDNELTGPIPAALGRLSTLRQLLLNNNRLTGSIPKELGRLTNLTALNLSDNQLTGMIPGNLRNLTNLISLYLGRNQLTGCVPTSLREVERNDLHQLDLADCLPGVVISLLIESSPLDGRAYGVDERIEVSVWFAAEVTTSGSPQLALMIGSRVPTATFVANRGNGQLAFAYIVGPADRDSNGISIATDALSLNGGMIQDVDGERAILDLSEHAIANHPSHQVRGALRELVPDQQLEAGGETLTLDLSRYFDVPEGKTLTYGTPISSDPAVATAFIEDGFLKIMPLEDGVTKITVTATDDNGVTVTLSFSVRVAAATRRLRPWLMGILEEQEATEAEAGADDPQ